MRMDRLEAISTELGKQEKGTSLRDNACLSACRPPPRAKEQCPTKEYVWLQGPLFFVD